MSLSFFLILCFFPDENLFSWCFCLGLFLFAGLPVGFIYLALTQICVPFWEGHDSVIFHGEFSH